MTISPAVPVIVKLAVPPEQVAVLLVKVTVGVALIVTVSLLVNTPEHVVVGLVTFVNVIVWSVVTPVTFTTAIPEASKVTGLIGNPATPV